MNYQLSRVKHIKDFLKLRYPNNKLLIVGTGIMAAAGLKKNDDIDVWATPDVFRQMKNDKNLKPIMKHGRLFYECPKGIIEISDRFPCTKGGINGYLNRATIVQGVYFMSMKDLRDWKMCMGRPKDKIAVQQIDRYMKTNITERIVDKLTSLYESEKDTNSPGYFIGPSKIHGQGVHAKKWLDPELRVGAATSPYPEVTPMGSKINHSSKPNCVLKQNGDGHDLVTTKGINPGEELTVDYGQYDEFEGPDPSWDN